MNQLKRKRVEAVRIPTFEDVHPHTKWTLCVRVFHKFHVEMFAPGRKRLYMVLLDEKAKKMVAVIYDSEVDRLEPLLKEGRAYFVGRMDAEPTRTSQEYKWADNHVVCRFTSVTTVNEVINMGEKQMPLFPPFMRFNKVWEFCSVNDTYVDVIGMIFMVSSIGQTNGDYNRKIPTIRMLLQDGTFNVVRITVFDKLVTDNLMRWKKLSDDRAIVVLTMLRGNSLEGRLETTEFSRMCIDPKITAANETRRRINNADPEINSPDRCRFGCRCCCNF